MIILVAMLTPKLKKKYLWRYMCLLRYLHRNLMHTGASLMYTEMNVYSEQEQNSVLSIK